MPRLVIAIFFATALCLAGLYYLLAIRPAAPYAHTVQHMLNAVESSVKTQDHTQIINAISGLLSDTAVIHLEIDMQATPGQTARNAVLQDFPKPSFLTFVDNMLYSLRNYKLKASLESLKLGMGHTTASLTFSADAQADSLPGSIMDGNAHFTGQIRCTADVLYGMVNQAQFGRLSCVMQLR
jgi:hypothetical protein